MAAISLGQAARLTGLGKTTITRAIKSGRLSASRRDDGSYEIDPAELSRVYPFKPAEEASSETVAATSLVVQDETLALEAEIAGLKNVAELLREQLDETRRDRDAWRHQAEASQRLLSDNRPRPGLVARLFRRTG